MNIKGSFLQLFSEVNYPAKPLPLSWKDEYWEKELKRMKEIEMNLLIIQFAVYNGFAYYDSKVFSKKDSTDHIKTIVDEAQKIDMDIFLGLAGSDNWWKNCNDDEYLKLEKDKCCQVFDELWSMYGDLKNIKGIYLSQELEDRSYQTKEKRERITKFIADLSNYCKKRDSKIKILISPFWGGYQPVSEYQKWWMLFLKETDVDIVALQDGVGCHRVLPDSDDLVEHYKALGSACEKNRKEFWSDLETFDQIHGIPLDDSPWEAVPASIERIENQIQIQFQLVSNIICFEYLHYMSPDMNELAGKLYKDYSKFIGNKGEL